jgi:hypothetical protein
MPQKNSTHRRSDITFFKIKTKGQVGQFVIDSHGNRLGVLLDLGTYERLLQAEEDLADIRAFDTALPQAQADLASGKTVSLSEYTARSVANRK